MAFASRRISRVYREMGSMSLCLTRSTCTACGAGTSREGPDDRLGQALVEAVNDRSAAEVDAAGCCLSLIIFVSMRIAGANWPESHSREMSSTFPHSLDPEQPLYFFSRSSVASLRILPPFAGALVVPERPAAQQQEQREDRGLGGGDALLTTVAVVPSED